MAIRFQFIPLFFMVLLYLVVMQTATECKNGHVSFYAEAASLEVHNRKVLYVSEHKEMVSKNGNEKNVVEWELREVPLGPDPLHHHGGSPKKPRTP